MGRPHWPRRAPTSGAPTSSIPTPGLPAAKAASASVTGPDLGLADALATAVAVAGEEGLAVVEAIDGYDAMIVTPDGAVRATAGFPIEAS